VFIDRWDRRRILTVTPLLRAALVALVPWAASGNADRPMFYLIVLVVLSANRFFLATMSALLPSLVEPDELLIANSLATTGGSIANVVGLGIGAAASSVVGGTRAGVVGGAAFLAAAALARLVPVARHARIRARLAGAIGAVARDLVDGMSRIRQSRTVMFAFSTITMMQALIGAQVGATAVLYITQFHLGVGAITGLLARLAVGIFAGVALVPFAARRVLEERLPALGFFIGGIASLVTAFALSRTTVEIGAFFAGVSFSFAKIPVDTMVQEALPDEFRGRAFAAYDMLYNVARIVGTAAAAACITAGAGETAIVFVGAVIYLTLAFVAAIAAVRLRAAVTREVLHPAMVPIPEQAPIFSGGEMVAVRAYAGSRADEEPRAIVLGDREIPVESVEWRAIEEREGARRRIFVVHAGGARIRLAYNEQTSLWEIDRVIRGTGRRKDLS
jgi:MFS family permease